MPSFLTEPGAPPHNFISLKIGFVSKVKQATLFKSRAEAEAEAVLLAATHPYLIGKIEIVEVDTEYWAPPRYERW
jgi:hypothetical protein